MGEGAPEFRQQFFVGDLAENPADREAAPRAPAVLKEPAVLLSGSPTFTMLKAQQAAARGGETIRAGYLLDGTAPSVYWTMLGKRPGLLRQGPDCIGFRRKATPEGSAVAMGALRVYGMGPPVSRPAW